MEKAKGMKKKRQSRDWLKQAMDARDAQLAPMMRRAKYAKMGSSVFYFFRGTNFLFWSDLAKDQRLARFGGPTTLGWLQGDMHVYNMGSFANARGQVVYDLNDFDDALVADFQMDLWRLAVSLRLIAQENLVRTEASFTREDEDDFVRELCKAYLDTLEAQSQDEASEGSITSERAFGRLDNFLEKVEKKSRAKMLRKWTREEGGRQVLLDESDYDEEPKLAQVSTETEDAIRAAMPAYGETLRGDLRWDSSYFAVKSVRKRQYAGTGSLGAERYYVLIAGKSEGDEDAVILDVKVQSAPSGYAHLPDDVLEFNQGITLSHALRSVYAYQALGAYVDEHLGWMELPGGLFSVRERSPYKDDFDTEELTSHKRFSKLAYQWGYVLATAHRRADLAWRERLLFSSREGILEAVAGRRDAFFSLTCSVSSDYVEQVEKDFETFKGLFLIENGE